MSQAKSRIFFSPNVSDRTKHIVCVKLGFPSTILLGKYLGFSIIYKGRSASDFHFLTEKIQAKLAGWKTRLLTPTGKLVLIKAAVTLVSEYMMQCFSIPIKICNTIDKITRDLLWGSSDEKRKLHMVSWKKITVPKELGGLGVFSMQDRNHALLAKFCWRIASESSTPWPQMLIQKYLTHSRVSFTGRKLPCSRI